MLRPFTGERTSSEGTARSCDCMQDSQFHPSAHMHRSKDAGLA
jgi:hypothetical protein